MGPILWLVILGVALWLGVSLLRPGDDRPFRRRERSPREILDERFARGEIDEEEYRRRRGVLDG